MQIRCQTVVMGWTGRSALLYFGRSPISSANILVNNILTMTFILPCPLIAEFFCFCFYVPLFPRNQPRPCLVIMQINEYTGNWAVSSSQSQRDMNQSCSVTAKSVWIVSRWLRRSQCWSLTDILPTKWTVTENL